MFNLPSDPLLRDYWVYEGSLTTPPCSENVTWILYRYPLTISQLQVKHSVDRRNRASVFSPILGRHSSQLSALQTGLLFLLAWRVSAESWARLFWLPDGLLSWFDLCSFFFYIPVQDIHLISQALLWLSYNTGPLTWGSLAFNAVQEAITPNQWACHIGFNSALAWPMALFKQVVVKDDDDGKSSDIYFSLSSFLPCGMLTLWNANRKNDLWLSSCLRLYVHGWLYNITQHFAPGHINQ